MEGNKRCEPFEPFKRRVRNGYSLEARLNTIVEKDPAVQLYIANVKARRRNNGYFSGHSKTHTLSCCRDILQYMKREINGHAITDLIAEVKEQHKREDYPPPRVMGILSEKTINQPVIRNKL
ncbi:MAG: hypothetical protein ACRD6W_14855 [Nitrososphaerales archaeon]